MGGKTDVGQGGAKYPAKLVAGCSLHPLCGIRNKLHRSHRPRNPYRLPRRLALACDVCLGCLPLKILAILAVVAILAIPVESQPVQSSKAGGGLFPGAL
jgi:hypothetical protein